MSNKLKSKNRPKMGVRAMYEELRRITGVEIEFDSMDLNKEFGFGGDE